jgi:uncharacterized membrane protein
MAIDSVIIQVCFASDKPSSDGGLVKSQTVHRARTFFVSYSLFLNRHLLLRFTVGTAISAGVIIWRKALARFPHLAEGSPSVAVQSREAGEQG